MNSCPICFDLFDGQDIVATPCGHVFHAKCLLKWVDTSKVCPECRNKITRNNVIKLFFNTTRNETLSLDPAIQNDLDSKKAELKAKNAELALALKKVKDLQEHAANTEQLYHTMYQKYLESQGELESSKLQLRKIEKLENKIKNLVQENVNLESQVTQFNHIHTVLQGTQQEAEEILREQGVLLAQEVGGQTAKNMANLCSILKRELFKLRAQKEEYKKKEDELLYQLGLKNAKLKKLLQSQTDLQRQLKVAYASPRPVMCVSNNANSESEHANPTTPVASTSDGKKIVSASFKDEEYSELTPISINFSDKKRPAMKKVVLDSLSTHAFPSKKPVSLPFSKPIFPPFKKTFDTDDDSITRVGYNGLGGHERVIFARARELSNSKPYKKNPNVKKGK